MAKPTKNNLIFILFAGLTLVAAVYHLVCLFHPLDQTPFRRHLIFFLLGIAGAVLFIRRPKYFVFAFGLLLIQQYYSHGTYLFDYWQQTHRLHWPSILVLALFPVALFFLGKDYLEKKRRANSSW